MNSLPFGIKSVKDIVELSRHMWKKHERHISTGALIVGFIVDYLTLTRIDRLFDNLVLITYLCVIAFGIVLVHFYHSHARMLIAPSETRRERIASGIQAIAPVVIQFAVGGMMSGLVVFYSRSATLGGTAPFLILLIAFMIGNEFLQERYQRLTLQVSVLYFVLFAYVIFAVPMLAGEIGTGIFVVSGVVSLILIGAFIRILGSLAPEPLARSRRYVVMSVFGIFAVLNVLYLTNLIPPVPLSLRHADIYHHLERRGAVYHADHEPDAWYEFIMLRDTFHAAATRDRIYAFSAIFAPRNLTTEIVHRWRFYDEEQEQWTNIATVPFNIIGGREGGFRGYTYISSVRAGRWRVDIRTQNGLLVGRIPFNVDITGKEPDIERVVLE